MSPNNKSDDVDQVRAKILDAAEARFRRYGYNKTTMAEIAKDSEMSAANLYRYFENKLGIGAYLACDCLDTQINELQSVVSQTEISAAQRLRKIVQDILNYTYTNWSEAPHINEMVMEICQKRMDIVDLHNHSKQALFLTLVKQGNASGEFNVADPEKAAEALCVAVTLFDVPLLMPLFSKQAFERKVEYLTDLLLNGLLKRD